MKRLLLSLLLVSSLACESERYCKPCICITDDKVPNVSYEVSKRNVILGIVFSETLVVPAVVLLTEFKCPKG